MKIILGIGNVGDIYTELLFALGKGNPKFAPSAELEIG